MTEENIQQEDLVKLLEDYVNNLKDLRTEISQIRKEGKDPLIADYLLRNVESKLDWIKHTKNKNDFEKIDEIFEQVKKELQEANERPIVNIKQEIEQMVKGEEVSINQNNNSLKSNHKFESKPKSETIKFESIKDEKSISKENEDIKPAIKAFEEIKESVKEQKAEIFAKREFIKLTDPKKFFYLTCGTYIDSIKDLMEKIPSIPDDCFAFHTKNYENDFSKWIQGVFNYSKLAKNIKGIKNKQEMIQVLEAYERGDSE